MLPTKTLLVPAILLVSTLNCLVHGDGSSSSSTCYSWSSRYQSHLEGVCVCNATHCDDIANAHLHLEPGNVGVYQTSSTGDRLAYSTLKEERVSDAVADLVIDTKVQFQRIIGFGGAFTDAAAINVYSLQDAVQQRLVDAYFSDRGLQYSLGRVPIASTDYSTSVYSYNPTENDLEMTNFSIAVDMPPLSNKIPFIQRALKTSSQPIQLFGSSWAPPVWMLRGNDTRNSKLKGSPGDENWKALALYYTKFVDAYEAQGIPMWGLTVQNEPFKQSLASKSWQSLRMNASDERDFLKKDLGPLMRKKHPKLQIMILDDQKDLLPTWDASLVDPDARQYVSGIGVHWYKNLDFLNAGGNFAELAQFHAKYPDVFILATEACEGYLPDGLGTGASTKLRQANVTWQRGEIYARDIANDLANFASGWTDWNLALNTSGGPSWAGNSNDAPILVDEEGHAEFYKQPMYYVMGHFAKFVPPNATRVDLQASNASSTTAKLANLDHVAFLTPSNQVVVVLSNRADTSIDLHIEDRQQQRSVHVSMPPHSIQTLLFTSNQQDIPTRSHASHHQPNLHLVIVSILLMAITTERTCCI